MPDKKLTDNEITIKVLKELLEVMLSEGDLQRTSTISHTIDLINRQKAEVERLKPFEDKIAEFNSHIRVEDMLVFASSLEEWLEFMQKTKAEAYKECIQKIKAKSKKEHLVCSGASLRTDYTITDKELNNLLKELVGDNNAGN